MTTANRRAEFQKLYRDHRPLLVDLAEHQRLRPDEQVWAVWLHASTQNIATTMLLGEASDWNPACWKKAVDFWESNADALDWHFDRRTQKRRFGEATEQWSDQSDNEPAVDWLSQGTWANVWDYAVSHPTIGPAAAWPMIAHARLLLGPGVPDAASWRLTDLKGSKSHRNALATISGADAWNWGADECDVLGLNPRLETLAEALYAEGEQHRSRLDMVLALDAYRRRMASSDDDHRQQIQRAEAKFGRRFESLWRFITMELV